MSLKFKNTKQFLKFFCLPAGFAHDNENHCGLSVLHIFEGHRHESHGHKTASSEHGEEERKADRKGISFIFG